MPDIPKETITTTENTTEQRPPRRSATSYQTAGYFIYFVFGLIGIVLLFRFILKLLGANPATGFVDFVYNLSSIFIAPFVGIFTTSTAKGNVTSSIFEPATLVALAAYAVLAWAIVALIRVVSVRKQDN